MMLTPYRCVLLILFFNGLCALPVVAEECADWKNRNPEWIFCDDFESEKPLVGPSRYFAASENEEIFKVSDDVGLEGSRGIRVRWLPGQVAAGGLQLSFGRNPQKYMDSRIRNDEDFRDIYYRMYLKMQTGWHGNPDKLSRITVFSSADDWSQAMIAHLWSGRDDTLLLDPVRCVNANSEVVCSGYNDFENMSWLGISRGRTKLFNSAHSGRWICIEHHVRLNDPGQSNGIQEFWIDDQAEALAQGLNFIGSWTEYGLNAIFFENYWNQGAGREQERYFDNIVVSTQRIGCL